jgi:hypothetical protein
MAGRPSLQESEWGSDAGCSLPFATLPTIPSPVNIVVGTDAARRVRVAKPTGRGAARRTDPRPSLPVEPSLSLRALRAAGALGLAAIGALVIHRIRPGALTDDTYAFLDWGRDLRHGVPLLLEQRTFQPLPIGAGAVLSLFGSAAPTVTVVLCLAALLLLAVAVWRIVGLLGFGQPAPAMAALLVLFSPMLPILALVGYNNLPFATLLLWGLVYELEGHPTRAWVLLGLGGLVRPEGWAFLVSYGALRWWRAGRPLAPVRWLAILALALGPMVLWVVLEWRLFGDALYSLHATTGPTVQHTPSGSPIGLWSSLSGTLTLPVLICAGVGAVAVARWAPRRAAITVLGMTLVAAVSLLVLAASSFNVPSRDFSVFVALLISLAAIGVTVPGRVLVSVRPSTARWVVAGMSLAAAALVLAAAAPTPLKVLHQNFKTIGAVHATGLTLRQATTRALADIDVRDAQADTVALYGAVVDSELIWDLGVPYDVVVDGLQPQSRVLVQPSYATWLRLDRLGLTNRQRWTPTPPWHLIVGGAWQVFVRGRQQPPRLD